MANSKQRWSALLILMALIQSYQADQPQLGKWTTEKTTPTGHQLMRMVTAYKGITYKLTSNHNLDEYLKALGVNVVKRILILLMTPEITLTQSGDEYTFTAKLGIKNIVEKFRIGVKFNYTTVEDREVEADVLFVGPGMIEQQVELKTGRKSDILRIFSDDELEEFLHFGNFTARRIYKRQL